MNSRIPNRNLRIETLVALGTRSTALLATEPAVAELAPMMAEANGRLVRANTARQEAAAARFAASRDRDLAKEALVTMVRQARHALLLECGGTYSHEAYRALFPRGQAPLIEGPLGRRSEALATLAAQLQADPAHADLAKRFGDALAAWKASVEAFVAARSHEAMAVRTLDQARADWTQDFTVLRTEAAARLKSVPAAKAFFPTSGHKADVAGDPAAGGAGAGDTVAAPAAGARVPETGAGAKVPAAGAAPPAPDLEVA